MSIGTARVAPSERSSDVEILFGLLLKCMENKFSPFCNASKPLDFYSTISPNGIMSQRTWHAEQKTVTQDSIPLTATAEPASGKRACNSSDNILRISGCVRLTGDFSSDIS